MRGRFHSLILAGAILLLVAGVGVSPAPATGPDPPGPYILEPADPDFLLSDPTAELLARQAAYQHKLEQRVVELQRRHYRRADSEERASLLAAMLDDELLPIRELALELAVQRLVDGGPFDEPLRAALRERLDDRSPRVRQRATLLLRDLADEPAAEKVAELLAEGGEDVSVEVTRAQLLMLARLPRVEGVGAALELLGRPPYRAEAAAALLAAKEADRLNAQQRRRAREQLRRDREAGLTPKPETIALLASLGTEEDWSWLRTLLDSDRGSIRRAAARAWASSQRSLEPLVDRLSDGELERIALRAVADRGRSGELLARLVSHEPADDAAASAWEDALAALAGRIGAAEVLEAVDTLRAAQAAGRLVERMLTAGIDARDADADNPAPSDERPAEARARLLLERARVRLDRGQPADALADLERVEPDDLDADPHALRRLRIRAHLQLEAFDEARDAARAELEAHDHDAYRAGDSPIDLYLEAADRHLGRDRPNRARDVLAALRELIVGVKHDQLAEAIATLEQRIARNSDDTAG